MISSPSYNDIVAQTYSGRVVCFTSEPLHEKDDTTRHGRSRGDIQKEGKIVKLRGELDALRKELQTKKEKFKKTTKSNGDGDSEFIALHQQVIVHQKMTLEADIAA